MKKEEKTKTRNRVDLELPEGLARCAKDYAKQKGFATEFRNGLPTLIRMALREKLNKSGYTVEELEGKPISRPQESS